MTSRPCVREAPPAVRRTLDSGPAAPYLRPCAVAIVSTAAPKATSVTWLNRRVTSPVTSACPGCRRSRPCRSRRSPVELFPVQLGRPGTCVTPRPAAPKTPPAASWTRPRNGAAALCRRLSVVVMETTAAPAVTPVSLTAPPAQGDPMLSYPGSPKWAPSPSRAASRMLNVTTRAAALQEQPAVNCRRESGAAARWSRRFAVQITSTAALRATPATCRLEHVRRRAMTRSSSPSPKPQWYSPSRETQKATQTYHVTARGCFAAPSRTRAVRSQPQSGPAAPHPGRSAALTPSTAVLQDTSVT